MLSAISKSALTILGILTFRFIHLFIYLFIYILILFVYFEENVVWKEEKECESENAKKILMYYLVYEIIYDCENREKK